jgi:hypothetical protein
MGVCCEGVVRPGGDVEDVGSAGEGDAGGEEGVRAGSVACVDPAAPDLVLLVVAPCEDAAGGVEGEGEVAAGGDGGYVLEIGDGDGCGLVDDDFVGGGIDCESKFAVTILSKVRL